MTSKCYKHTFESLFLGKEKKTQLGKKLTSLVDSLRASHPKNLKEAH